jgi:hypothetical protein
MHKAAKSNSGHLVFDLSIDIPRSTPGGFRGAADIQDFKPLPIDAQVKMTKHPVSPTRVGARWDEKARVLAGWWLSTQSVVTDIEGPATIGMDLSSRWFDGHLTYALDTSEDGTTLHQHELLRLRWPLRCFGSQVERKLRSQLEKRLTDALVGAAIIGIVAALAGAPT